MNVIAIIVITIACFGAITLKYHIDKSKIEKNQALIKEKELVISRQTEHLNSLKRESDELEQQIKSN